MKEKMYHKHNHRCSICQYEFEAEDIIKPLPCEHLYHTECINIWLKTERTCPVCKIVIDMD